MTAIIASAREPSADHLEHCTGELCRKRETLAAEIADLERDIANGACGLPVHHLRLKKQRASTLENEIMQTETEKLIALAGEMDVSAAAFRTTLVKFLDAMAARKNETGRAPSVELLRNGLERAHSVYLEGTPLRSARGPSIVRRTFAEMAVLWTNQPATAVPAPDPAPVAATKKTKTRKPARAAA